VGFLRPTVSPLLKNASLAGADARLLPEKSRMRAALRKARRRSGVIKKKKHTNGRRGKERG